MPSRLSPRLQNRPRAVEKRRDDKQLPNERAADKVKNEHGPRGVGDEHVGEVTDARALDDVHGEQAGDEAEDLGHDGEGAGGVDGGFEEADEVAGGGADDGEAAEGGEARVRVALGVEGYEVVVGVVEEGYGCCDGEEDGNYY